MKRAAILSLLFLAFVACSAKEERPLSEPGEKLYTLRGVIVTRTPADNSLRVDHEAIPGYMAAMVMDYPVRGADVVSLPADRSRIEAQLHVTGRRYWLTDVRVSRPS